MREYKVIATVKNSTNMSTSTEKSVSLFYNLFKPEYLALPKHSIATSSTNFSTLDGGGGFGLYSNGSDLLGDDLYNSYSNLTDLLGEGSNGSGGGGTRLGSGGGGASEKFQRNLVQFLLEGIGIAIITIFGIIGNSLSIIVLMKASMRCKPINRLLLCLAITDTIYITGVLSIISLPNIYAYFQIDFTQTLLMASVPYVYPIGMSAQTASVYFTIIITIERYIAVCHPIYVRRICTKQRTTVVGILVTLFAICYNIPRWLEYTYVGILSESTTSSSSGGGIVSGVLGGSGGGGVESPPPVLKYMVMTTPFRKNKTYETYYIKFGYFTFISTLPILILVVLNSFIYRTVKLANVNRKHLSATEKKENSLAVMLLFIVIIFLVCNIISLINLFARIFTGRKNIPVLDSLRNFALVFNSSVNFIIYCTYGEKFRATILRFLLPGRFQRSRQSRKMSSVSIYRGQSSCRRTSRSQRRRTGSNVTTKIVENNTTNNDSNNLDII